MNTTRKLYIAGAIALTVAAFFTVKALNTANKAYVLETAKVERGTLNNTVTATGTLEAITTVEVGTQVSGVIDRIFVDFNSQVSKGQKLAQIDETPLRATLEQSKASVDQSEAELKYQQATYFRYKELIAKDLIAQSDFDLAEYNYHKALATLNNAKSVYEKNRINLSYATIFSPIDGIILDRAVDEGQTVAASFNTPTLFTIANDLTQMQVEANVDEADIGLVKVCQRVEFTVDAYADMKFVGEVTEIRLLPVETSNVITYTVIINAPNPDKKLMPGMTANTTVFVKELTDILIVPGKAVRFSPAQADLEGYVQSLPKPDADTAPRNLGGSGQLPPQTDTQDQTLIWVKKGTFIHQVPVKLGETDGINHQLIEGLNEGDELVTSLTIETDEAATSTTAKSPFMPQRPKR